MADTSATPVFDIIEVDERGLILVLHERPGEPDGAYLVVDADRPVGRLHRRPAEELELVNLHPVVAARLRRSERMTVIESAPRRVTQAYLAAVIVG